MTKHCKGLSTRLAHCDDNAGSVVWCEWPHTEKGYPPDWPTVMTMLGVWCGVNGHTLGRAIHQTGPL